MYNRVGENSLEAVLAAKNLLYLLGRLANDSLPTQDHIEKVHNNRKAARY